MTAFAPLLGLLEAVPDPRRAEGKVSTGCRMCCCSRSWPSSAGAIHTAVATFIDEHRRRLNRAFDLTWRRAPAHTSIRNILSGFAEATDRDLCIKAMQRGMLGGAI